MAQIPHIGWSRPAGREQELSSLIEIAEMYRLQLVSVRSVTGHRQKGAIPAVMPGKDNTLDLQLLFPFS
ncbi:hypothetical protein B2K_39145 [Paenibacillus mucilaginosus K02]|uniref:Uncharacterized protein n=1 Tax=Paenibacillus mucilaginosus K02 TaxID=997761 RepID=R9UN18_9BACL|nr:hypothetical protein B2K_39145 [Paenibacillus mucilaginosus K02]